MIRRAFALAWLALAGATPAGAVDASAPPGASSCSGCHGMPRQPSRLFPAIWGRPADELAAAFAAYRDGTRDGTVMPRIAKGFTAEEGRVVSAWWAGQR